MHPGAQLEQAKNLAARHDFAGRGLNRARQQLEDGRLAGPVWTDDSQRLACRNLNVDPRERPEFFVLDAPPTQQRQGHALPRTSGLVPDPEALAYATQFNSGRHLDPDIPSTT